MQRREAVRRSRRPGDHRQGRRADETRKCAASAIGKGFPELGKSYVLAIPMAEIGPVTVLALGIGDSAGWGAYSCDPDRKCLPVKIGAPNEVGQADDRAAGEGLRARRRRSGSPPTEAAATCPRRRAGPPPPTHAADRREVASDSDEAPTRARTRDAAQPTQARALRKMRIHGRVLAPAGAGARSSCTVRNTRSGCGMMMVTRPSGVVTRGDAVGRAVRVVGVALGRRGRGCRRSARRRSPRASSAARSASAANSARPSPCATAIGMREPAMPAKKHRRRRLRSRTSARRASNCSVRLRTKRGQALGARDDLLAAFDIIWQPLQTPSAKVSGAREERRERVARARR